MAKGLKWRGLHSAADLQVTASYPHAIGKFEVSLRNRAQESTLGESGGRPEVRWHSYRRSTQSPHRNRFFRVACLGQSARGRQRTVEDAADFGSGVLRNIRSRYPASLVERCRRASEPYIPRA